MSPAESKSWSNTNRVRMFGEWYKSVAECLKNQIISDWLCENWSMDYYSNFEPTLTFNCLLFGHYGYQANETCYLQEEMIALPGYQI